MKQIMAAMSSYLPGEEELLIPPGNLLPFPAWLDNPTWFPGELDWLKNLWFNNILPDKPCSFPRRRWWWRSWRRFSSGVRTGAGPWAHPSTRAWPVAGTLLRNHIQLERSGTGRFFSKYHFSYIYGLFHCIFKIFHWGPSEKTPIFRFLTHFHPAPLG